MFHFDLIIPCYGESKLINRGLSSLATQWKSEYIHVTLVNDCSPNTDCDYQDLVDKYKDEIDIRVIKTPKNVGQGLARQFGIDNTRRDWFMFMDEDDQIATGIAISQIVGAAEGYYLDIDENGMVPLDKNGKPRKRKGIPKLALVSPPLFEFDDNHTHVISANNQIWLNGKLYNRKFVEKHNVRFNEAQSRHAEDYFWGTCLFHCLNNDKEYAAILLDDKQLFYLWYPNEQSQSRSDPNYGFMLSGYTMGGSVNILRFIKNNKTVKFTKEVKEQYKQRVLDMTVYSFFTFLSFIRRVASSDYVPAEEEHWTLLRDACYRLKEECKLYFDEYDYMRVVEQLHNCKNHSDVHYTEPWITFEDYIRNGMKEHHWSYKTLLECRYKFDKEGRRVWD